MLPNSRRYAFLNARKLDISKLYLENQDKYVFPFEIKEKNKVRKIITYNKDVNYGLNLRSFHEIIRDSFESNFCQRNKHSYAYHKGVRCLDAIDDHLKSKHFIKLDIHHFFESITFDAFMNVYGKRFNDAWKKKLECCFYYGSLSIGFVTSPLLSDFYMSVFDNEIEEYLLDKPKLHYSRYSDDMLLSSEEEDIKSLVAFFEFVKEKLSDLGLEINDKKTQRITLSYEKHNSIPFLGLNISKANEIDNKVTISKNYILFLLFLIEKNERYESKCRELINEINSRVAYLYYNSKISYARFQKKYQNIYGKEYEFIPHIVSDRNRPEKSNEINNFDDYAKEFSFNIHAKVVDGNQKQVISSNCIELKKYLGIEKEVVIPDFVESIGDKAFAYSKVEKVILPKGLRAICASAFANSSLKEIVLTGNIKYIGPSAFAQTKIKNIVIPNKVKMISKNAFTMTLLENIELGNVEAICDGAFGACEFLKKVIIPETVTMIEPNAFMKCKELKEVIIKGEIYDLPSRIFSECISLEKIELNDYLLTIGEYAFSSCLSLKEIYIPKSITNIEYNAFRDCKNLKGFKIDKENRVYDSRDDSHALIETNTNKLVILTDKLEIPSSIEIIGKYAFKGRLIKEINLPKNLKKIEVGAFSNCRLLKHITIPNNVTDIDENAFSRCLSLKEVVLPNNINEIKNGTFEYCISLEKINLGDNIKTIGENAFNNNRLLAIELPNSIKKIGFKAFSKCYATKELFIPKSVKEINDYAFYGLSKTLEKIVVDKGNKKYRSDNSNSLIEKKPKTLLLGCKNTVLLDDLITINDSAFMDIKELKEINIPDSLKEIKAKAFYNCKSLKNINLNNIYKIGKYAFSKCDSLEKVVINSSLVKLGSYAFAECINLEEIDLPNSISEYGENAFHNCKKLKRVKLPSNYDNYNRGLFLGCDNIEELIVAEGRYSSANDSNAIYVELPNGEYKLLRGCMNTTISSNTSEISKGAFKDVLGLKKIIIPVSVTKIDEEAFAYCKDLEEIEIPGTISMIPSKMFYNCERLKKVILNEGIEVIKDQAFTYCKSLEEIIIPESVEVIGRAAFKGCEKLKRVILPNQVNTIEDSVFEGCKSLAFIDLDNISEFGRSAFKDCVSLKPIFFNEDIITISTIRDNAFEGNPNITSFTTSGVLQLAINAFVDCDNFKGFNVENNNAYCYLEDGNLYRGNMLVFGKTEEIKEGTEIIGSGSYLNNDEIRKIVLPKSVYSIRSGAFYGCSNLETIIFNDGIREIRESAFEGCDNLKEVILPDSLITLGHKAFASCKNIKKIYIPKMLRGLYNSFDDSLENLEEIKVAKDNELFTDYDSNVIADKRNNIVIYGAMNSKIPDGVVEITSGAFKETKIKDLIIPDSVHKIDPQAFAFCKELRKISIGKNAYSINPSAFVGLEKLENIEVSKDNNSYKVVDGALIDVSNNMLILGTKDVKIPAFVEVINIHALSSKKEIDTLTISENVKSINISGDSDSYININNVNVDSDNPLYYSDDNNIIEKGTETLILAASNSAISNNVKILKENSFRFAKKMKKVVIPKNVNYISMDSFKGMDNLEEIMVDEDNKIYECIDNTIILKNGRLVIASFKNSIIPEDTICIKQEAVDKNYKGFGEVIKCYIYDDSEDPSLNNSGENAEDPSFYNSGDDDDGLPF